MKDKFDKNLSVENTAFDDCFKLYDITKPPFKLYGNCTTANNIFARMPESIATEVSEGVADRAARSSGVRVRFKTNSRKLGIRVKFSKALQFPAQSAISTKGFDIYVDGKYSRSVFGEDINSLSYEQVTDLRHSEEKDVVIYFPYNAVIEEIILALEKDAFVKEGDSYNISTPMVFYGSSITHGFCVSRPGNTFSAMLSRELDSDYINLGFAGVCRGEERMAQYLASLKKSVLVCEYDHNEKTCEDLKVRHLPFYEKIRETDSETPILFISSPNLICGNFDMHARMKVVEDTYNYALKNGDKNVYFINGHTLYPNEIRFDCSADAIHPNDLGAYMIAEKMYESLKKILYK